MVLLPWDEGLACHFSLYIQPSKNNEENVNPAPMVRKQRPWLRTEFALKSVPKADPGTEAGDSGEQRARAEKVPEVKQAKNILSRY